MNNSTARLFLLLWFVAQTCVAADPGISLKQLRDDGAFGFPQKDSRVVCDEANLRLSLWNNEDYLFVQAVLWKDGDATAGKTDDNREIGDWSSLMLDVDGDGKATARVDRNYMLNPWPHLPGLHYQVVLGNGSTTSIQSDSKGQGAIRYAEIADGMKVRVDSYLIPLAELSRRPRDKINLCYWGKSPTPQLTVNSVGYNRDGGQYYDHQIPHAQYHSYILGKGRDIDTALVPEGRKDIALSTRKKAPMPKVGDEAPEISAKDWINSKDSPTLAGLRGKVVLVEFWATWCGPCVQCIPHLNKLHEKYGGKDFQLLSLVEEGHQTMDRFLKRTPVDYAIGLESQSLDAYGVTGIPHAFVIDREGKVAWHGHSASDEMVKAIERALKQQK